jgi:prepilin-type N-terminal cleavage/methylation domain-containing protein
MNKKTKQFNSIYRLRAFTLVELLVVISIIAVLLAILIPSLKRAKEKAAQVTCTAHLKQIGAAMGLYAIDYRDLFPDCWTTGGWHMGHPDDPRFWKGFQFRAAPGYKDPTQGPLGLNEKFGLAGVLGKSDYYGKSPAGAYIDGKSKVWVCSSNASILKKWEIGSSWGNTYAFSTATMLGYTKTYNISKTAWLVYDNYMYKPYDPGQISDGKEQKWTIPIDQRVLPHKKTGKEGSRAINVLYGDLRVGWGINQ